jgi:hypothetical protein
MPTASRRDRSPDGCRVRERRGVGGLWYVHADVDLVRRLAAADDGLAVVTVPRGGGTIHASVVNAGHDIDVVVF